MPREPAGTTTSTDRERHSWEGVSVAAERYERDLVPALFEGWADVLLDLADVGPGDRVLDLACGTGVVARAAARRVTPGGQVFGVDVNDDMLAIARTTGAGVDWRHAEASDTGLADASIDAAFCQQGLQFFPDRPAALRELRRVVVPAGRAMLATWCRSDGGDRGYTPIAAALQRHLPGDATPLAFIDAIFALSDGNAVAQLAESAGFEDVIAERRTATVQFPSAEAWVDAFLGAAPVASISTLEPETRAAIVAEAASALDPYVGPEGVAFPLHTNIVRCGARSR